MKKLNFSCGNDIREGWDNCDWQVERERENLFHCDANEFPYPIKDNTYDHVEMRQCLQLFEDIRKVLFEIRRICKPNATIHIDTAHYGNKGAYCDLDTRHWFNENSFLRFLDHNCRIHEKDMFELISLKLTSTRLGKLMPEFVRKRLSLMIFGIYEKIIVDLRVKK